MTLSALAGWPLKTTNKPLQNRDRTDAIGGTDPTRLSPPTHQVLDITLQLR